MKIAVVSQKGGVSKSTLSRLLAREYSKAKKNVLIADMDINQATSFEWQARRLQKNIQPEINVQQFKNVNTTKHLNKVYDLIIYDGAPASSKQTLEIAKISTVVLLPTGGSIDDMNPQIRLAHALVKNGIKKKRIAFILSKTGSSDVENLEARTYITDVGYEVISGEIPEKVGYRRAMDEGKTLTETPYATLNIVATKVAQCIVKKIKTL